MNPSSSSNAEAPRAASFRVATRGLAADLARAGGEQSARDLGDLSAAGLADLFVRYLALDSTSVEEADAHLVVAGRRGRFNVHSNGAALLFQPVGDPSATYVNLSPADAPAWLDHSEENGADPADPASASDSPADARPRRAVFAVAFAVVSVLVLAVSAWLSFAPASIEPDHDYAPLTNSTTLGALRQSVPGLYATSDDAGERHLEVRADGTLVYREPGPHHTDDEDRTGRYAFALHVATKTPVLRVEGLGTVHIRDPQHLEFVKETYTRRAAK